MEITPPKKFSANALTDLKLVEAAKLGNQKAYTDLMSRYQNAVYFLILKMVHNKDDAMDVTLDTFGKAFEKLDKYQPIFAFSTWLFRVATNNSIDFIRKQKLQTIPIDEGNSNDDDGNFYFTIRSIKDNNPNPEENSVKKQEFENVKNIINQLPLRYKTIFSLRYFDELSYEEISEQLDIPMGTVKTRLFKCRDLLSNMINGINPKKKST